MIVTEEWAKKNMICAERCYSAIEVLCQGRRCMAWRVYDRVKVGEKFHVEVLERGYCGLAGIPRGKFHRWRGHD